MKDAVNDGSDLCEIISKDEADFEDVIKIDACESFFERADFLEGHTPEDELILTHFKVNK